MCSLFSPISSHFSSSLSLLLPPSSDAMVDKARVEEAEAHVFDLQHAVYDLIMSSLHHCEMFPATWSPKYHTHTHTRIQLHVEESARNEVEAKLNAATETLDEKEKQLNETVAQKDTEIFRLSEEVKKKIL